jgi:signal transduction histidine kinase/DNA-binding response OmpR family regulator
MKKKILVFLLFNTLTLLSFGQKVILSENEIPENINSFTSIFEDKTATMSLDEVQKQKFSFHKTRAIRIPFSPNAYWLKITFQNATSSPQNLKLEYGNSFVEYIDFFIPNESGLYKITQMGTLSHFKKDILSEYNPRISISILAKQEKTIFIKIKSARGHNTNLLLFKSENYNTGLSKSLYKDGFVSGLLFLRFFYVLLIALFAVKELVFRRYSLLLVMRTLAYWGLNNVLGEFFTNDPMKIVTIDFMSYHILPIGQVMVVMAILPIEKFPRFVKIILQLVIVINVILGLLIVFDYGWSWLLASTYLIIFTQLSIFGLYAVAIFRKFPFNRYYSIPFLLGIGSYIFLQMRLIGWMDFFWILPFAFFCFVSEIFVFGLFLGRYIINYERTRAISEKEILFNQAQTQRLQELDTLKTNFFTNISHELRTPLTILAGPLEEFSKKYPTEKIVPAMQRNVSRLQSLINQLLDLSKLEAGQLKVEMQESDLAVFMRQLMASFESLAQSKNIIFHTEQSHSSFLAVFDADKIEKIVTNLLSNAFKFTNESGRVNIRIDYSANEMNIQVQDFGIGIESSRLEKIFDRFYQADGDSNNKKFEGTGIGLALVKELVEVLKGNISVESEINKGTLFQVILPISKGIWKENLQTKEITTKKDNSQFGDNQLFTKNTSSKNEDLPIILVIEDNPDLRLFMVEILENSYQVFEASDGQDGVEKALEIIPDLIISDLMMPRLDGFGVCKTLKADVRTSHIPIIILTAKATQKDKNEGLELGADDYLSKPFNTDELRIRVKNLVTQRETLRLKYSQLSVDSITAMPLKVPSMDEQFLQKAIEIVEKNMADSTFDLEQFCEQMNMSRATMHRKLKAITNQTTTEFIRNLRLQKAAKLLKQKTGTVSDIAYQVGFENLPYFSKTFQEFFGVSPSEWAK